MTAEIKTPRTDAAIKESARGWSYQPLVDESRKLERELSDLRAKLAAAEKDAERKDSALRVARAAAIHGTTDGGKAVARMIDAAIEKERSRDC